MHLQLDFTTWLIGYHHSDKGSQKKVNQQSCHFQQRNWLLSLHSRTFSTVSAQQREAQHSRVEAMAEAFKSRL